MPEGDSLASQPTEWIRKADNDLRAAVHTLKLGANCPGDVVAFHAQQCVEKYLKALMVSVGREAPKIHDIEVLFLLLPPFDPPLLSGEQQADLSRYAARTRYPGSDDVSLAEARAAVALARRVRAEVRRKLPKAALRRPKVRLK